MKTTFFNFLLAVGFISFPYLAAEKLLSDANIEKMVTKVHTIKSFDTSRIGSMIDSIDILNSKLNENTYKTLSCDNKILQIKKKQNLSKNIHRDTVCIISNMEDSCYSVLDSLTISLNQQK